MADHDVGGEAEMAQPVRRLEHRFRSPHAVIQLAGGNMGFLDRQRWAHVRNFPHAADFVLVRLRYEQDFVPAGNREVTNDVEKLSGVILMDKQKAHAPPSSQRSAATAGSVRVGPSPR